MKIFIFILTFCIAGVASQAQPVKGTLKWASYGNSSDTLNNTTAETTNPVEVGQNGAFSATVTLVLISGTSGGKIYWEADNGNDFFVPVDSVTMTQQNFSSNTYKYSAAPFAYHRLRVRIVPTGTQSQRVVGTFRKQN